MPDNLLNIFYALIITFGLLFIVCYIIELVSWIREESQPKWVRNVPLITLAGLIVFGLVA